MARRQSVLWWLCLLVVALVLAGCGARREPSSGAVFHVAPDGTPGGDGSAESPWDLTTALLGPATVKPGDTIVLAAGTYRVAGGKNFTTQLKGTPEAPIIIRPAAGARATIDLHNGEKGTERSFYIGGAHTIYRDLEFMSSNPVRNGLASWQIGAGETGGAEGVKVVNCILHDLSNIGFWRSAVDAELYGCLIYHVGNDGRDGGGHGHGVYSQNVKGTQRVQDNIVFNQFSCGIAPHGSMAAVNMLVEGNVCFNNGVLGKKGQRYNYFLWTADPGSHDVTFRDNFGYVGDVSHPEKAYGANMVNGTQLTMEGNYFVGGGTAFSCREWDSLTIRGNKIFGPDALVTFAPPPNRPMKDYQWDRNEYTALGGQAKPFLVGEDSQKAGRHDWQAWRRLHGFDAHSTFSTERPTAPGVFVRPNRYERGRANVIIYNWPRAQEVAVDLSPAGLKKGDKFVLLDAQNFFAKPVVEGTWTGKPVAVPMGGLTVVSPTGDSFVPPRHTGPDFAVFVLRKRL